MKSLIREFAPRYIIFIVSLAVITGIALLLAEYTLDQLEQDTVHIEMSGEQSLLIQRIMKNSLIVERGRKNGEDVSHRVDTLQELTVKLDALHDQIVREKPFEGDRLSDSLLVVITPMIKELLHHSQTVIDAEHDSTLHEAIDNTLRSDFLLVNACTQLTDAWQWEAQRKHDRVATSFVFLAGGEVLFFVIGFAMIMLPALKLLKSTNKELTETNHKLQSSYHEGQATEEELRGSLDQVQSLRQHLEVKERQYRELVENAGDLIYELDEQGKFIYCNPQTTSVTGYSFEQLRSKFYWEIIHPDHRNSVKDFYTKQRKRRQEDSSLELPLVNVDGETVWISQRVHMFFNEQGWVFRVNAIAHDITDLKKVREELEESERLYRIISTNSKDLISYYNNVDNEPIRTFVSPSVREIMGYEPEEMINKSPYDFIHPEDVIKMRQNTHPLTQQGKSAYAEYRARKKDGNYVWLESYSQPVFNEEGKQVGFQTSARDITSRKETEAVLKDAKEKAEDAANAKSQFLSMMSHEIRTPMNAVIGLTNFLLEGSPREDQAKHLQLLKFSGENLLTIINDILDFSKIEAGKISLEKIPFNFRNLMNNIMQMFEYRAREKNIGLKLQYDDNIPVAFRGDPVRINQVLNNLLSNAIKFTEKGSVTLSVSQAAVDDATHFIAFRVTDTGIGIEQENLNLIFERFAQASSYTSRRFGGTGLGLAISKRLLQLMGGQIQVTSQRGSGSEFSFTLPLEKARLGELVFSEQSYVNDNRSLALKVLLVEDNEVNQTVAINYLEKWGCSVEVAANGMEALEMIKRKSVDIVLMDLQMPEMDGYETTRLIRAMEDDYFKNVPIIALTASAMNDVSRRLQDIGINDYIAKPFDPKKLKETIARFGGKASGVIIGNEATEEISFIDADLATKMVNNIKDFEISLKQAIDQKKPEVFSSAVHKMKTTFALLKNDRFVQKSEELKVLLPNSDVNASGKLREVYVSVLHECRSAIEHLKTLT